MPHAITWEQNGVYVKYWGEASIANVHDMMEKVGADPKFDNLRYILADYLDVEEQNVTEGEVEEIAAIGFAQGLTNPRYLHAAVATDEKILYLLRHWKQNVPHPDKVGYFATVEQARQWIRQQQDKADAEWRR